jgi:cell division septum initiation protein DivIVA
MDLAPETTEKFSDLDIIAHCLYEMTFIGYNEEEISEQFETINDRVEEYKNLTKEEKEEKIISLDELERRLNQKGSS